MPPASEMTAPWMLTVSITTLVGMSNSCSPCWCSGYCQNGKKKEISGQKRPRPKKLREIWFVPGRDSSCRWKSQLWSSSWDLAFDVIFYRPRTFLCFFKAFSPGSIVENFYVPSLTQMRKIYCFPSSALDFAHVKFDVLTRPSWNTRQQGCEMWKRNHL